MIGPADTRPDQARVDVGRLDVRPDVVVAGDTRDALVLRDARNPDIKGDAGGGDGGVKVDAGRDGKLVDARDASGAFETGKPDSPVDAVAAKDTTPDIKKIDAPVDVPPPNGCLNPIIVSTDDPKVDVTVDTTGESHKFDLPCAATGPDVVIKVNLGQTELLYADTFGTNWNTVLHFSKTCPPSAAAETPGPGQVVCSDDACASKQSQVMTTTNNPVYYLFLGGANGESGLATIHFQHAAIGTGPLKQLASGTGSVSGTSDNNTRPPSDVCEAAGTAESYWWPSCPDYAGGTFTASTCTGSTYDTLLSLQIPRTSTVTCADDADACGNKSILNATIPAGAGLNVLSIFGVTYRAFGPYVITYTSP